jgi:hypothetical protein
VQDANLISIGSHLFPSEWVSESRLYVLSILTVISQPRAPALKSGVIRIVSALAYINGASPVTSMVGEWRRCYVQKRLISRLVVCSISLREAGRERGRSHAAEKDDQT